MSTPSPLPLDPNPHDLPPGQLYPFVVSVTLEELSLYAAFLARDMGFDGAAAREKPILWYREQAGRDACTVTNAAHLRQLTIQECEPSHRRRLPRPDALRDFAREDVADAQANRERRARLFSFLPGRIAAGLPVDVEAAIDAEFDERSKALTEAYAARQAEAHEAFAENLREAEEEDARDLHWMGLAMILVLAALGLAWAVLP